MEKIKKMIRLLILGCMILLALSGVFFTVTPRRQEQDRDNEIKTELVEGKEEDGETKEAL